MNKSKILVSYNTNKNSKFQKYFNKQISKSIGCEHTIIPFENEGEYSLTHSYNHIWKCHEETNPEHDQYILVYIHHDINFKCNGWGKNLLNLFNSSDYDIIGIAGTDMIHSHCSWWLNESGQFVPDHLWGKVWHTNGKKTWKSDFTHEKKINKIQPVVTIDGVFISFNPMTCLKFDEEFDNFHFYDISFCIENFINGRKIGVIETIPICHESIGQVDIIWEEHRQKLSQKYSDKFPIKI